MASRPTPDHMREIRMIVQSWAWVQDIGKPLNVQEEIAVGLLTELDAIQAERTTYKTLYGDLVQRVEAIPLRYGWKFSAAPFENAIIATTRNIEQLFALIHDLSKENAELRREIRQLKEERDQRSEEDRFTLTTC